MIFFDLDGTLYRTAETSLPPLRRLSAKYGIQLDDDIESEYLCLTTEAFLKRAAPSMGEADQMAFRNELWNEERNEIRANGRLFEGMENLLVRLVKRNVPLALCTMSGADYVEEVLQKTGIARYFQVVLTHVKGKTKAMFLKDYLQNHPEDAVDAIMIGDSWVDEDAAKANNLPFVCMTHGYDSTRRSQSVRTADNAAMLEAILREIHPDWLE